MESEKSTGNDVASHRGRALHLDAQDAIQAMDIDRCRRVITQASIAEPEAVTALCTLLGQPVGLSNLRKWRREPYISMRVLAIDALKQFSSAKTGEVLARAALFDSPKVRQFAIEALEPLKGAAVKPLLDVIHQAKDWTLDAMLSVINAITNVGNVSEIRRLVTILYGRHPAVPERWIRWQIKRGLVWYLVICLLCFVLFKDEPYISVWQLLITSFITSIPVAIIPCGMLYLNAERRRRKEFAEIYSVVVDALTDQHDVRAIPGLIWAASIRHSPEAFKEACRGLKALLPQLTAENLGLLDSHAEMRLTDLFSTSDGDLAVAVVRALEFVGTRQSIAPLERLISNLGSPEEDEVFKLALEEAISVHSYLVGLLSVEEAGSELLRASTRPPHCGDDLLRPAVMSSEPPNELLRPDQLI